MIDACRPFDIGLSLETGAIPNTRVLLSNKVFTYLLAGLATIYSDTPAQRAFAMGSAIASRSVRSMIRPRLRIS